MQFTLDEDRALLQRSTRELLEKEGALTDSRRVMEEAAEGYSKSLHAQLGELGYLGVLLPESEGGLGAIAFAAVLHEMGRVALPGPFLEVALAVRLLAGCEGEAAKRWRAKAAAGEAIVVLARSESLASADPGAVEASCAGGRVRGTKRFVPFGAQADALLVETREGIALVERPALDRDAERPSAGWDATPLPTIDHAQRFAEIRLDAPATLVAEGERACTLLGESARLGALGAAAVLLGLMERSLETAVAYMQERQAFGAPIASFQALQHRAADCVLQTESTRSAVYRAAAAEEQGGADAALLAAVAKAWAGPAARLVCGEALQFHGGVGFTWEYDPHLYLKRAKTLELFHGSTRSQLEAVLRAKLAAEEKPMATARVTRTLDVPADALWQLVSDFGDTSWMPGPPKVERVGSGPGMERRIQGPDKAIHERLESVDEASRTLVYTIPVNVPFPVTGYRATMRVTAKGAGSELDWSASFTPAGAPEEAARKAIEGMYGVMIGWIETRVKAIAGG
jgi:alkylation response protein AidB-like acyl-CoA dehydrogenase